MRQRGSGAGKDKRECRKHNYSKFYVNLYISCQIRRQYLCAALACSPLSDVRAGKGGGEREELVLPSPMLFPI